MVRVQQGRERRMERGKKGRIETHTHTHTPCTMRVVD